MFVIITYDVKEKRVTKVCKKLREYLHWTQNSVFEGDITKGSLRQCLHQLGAIIDPDEDSVYLYRIENPRHIHKEVIGKSLEPDDVFL